MISFDIPSHVGLWIYSLHSLVVSVTAGILHTIHWMRSHNNQKHSSSCFLRERRFVHNLGKVSMMAPSPQKKHKKTFFFFLKLIQYYTNVEKSIKFAVFTHWMCWSHLITITDIFSDFKQKFRPNLDDCVALCWYNSFVFILFAIHTELFYLVINIVHCLCMCVCAERRYWIQRHFYWNHIECRFSSYCTMQSNLHRHTRTSTNIPTNKYSE